MNTIANPAITVVTRNATQPNANTTKWGMARNIFTSHSQRERFGSSSPVSRTG